VLARDPENAAALNYLGYMLAERGERLDESVAYVKKALEIEPENGSYLDSLGWAYFKAEELGLAEENLKRAAGQLQTNSVVQDHYGQVLFQARALSRRHRRVDTRAERRRRRGLTDRTSIGRSAVARQKLEKNDMARVPRRVCASGGPDGFACGPSGMKARRAGCACA